MDREVLRKGERPLRSKITRGNLGKEPTANQSNRGSALK